MPEAGAHPTNLPVVFNFGEHTVRTVEKDGEVWFVAIDVCQVLDIVNTRQAAGRLDDDERDCVCITDAIGRERDTIIVNESGLYGLILSSRKPEARAFKRWVTHDVLPAIRRSGSYGTVPREPARIDPRALLLSGQSTRTVEMSPKLTEAIDQRAWTLTREAYELIREHLRRRAAFHAEGGQPRILNERIAMQAIREGDLGDALARVYADELRYLL